MQVGVHHPFAPTPPPADGFAALLWAASAIRRAWRLIAVGAAACLTPAVIYLAGALTNSTQNTTGVHSPAGVTAGRY